MSIEDIRNYALQLPDAEECFPFGEETLVFKINGKIFLLASLNEAELRFNVKCEPEKAITLREKYPAVLPGYHMNKKHWNTIVVDGTIKSGAVLDFIKDSYLLVKGK
jgi:predicted DNA-binding protein (MmcQ/YjbR family)